MSSDGDVLAAILRTIWKCECHHSATCAVLESTTHPVFNGNVECFTLVGHPSSEEAFAWFDGDRGIRNGITVLKEPPIWDAADAVRAADQTAPTELAKLIRRFRVNDQRWNDDHRS
jgi:hypothetical protein